jgi:8-oxo-dGTP pyrophosphatase MutT (NUDIX family)
VEHIQRTLVSLILSCGPSILLLQRGLPYSEFRRYDPSSRVGVNLWELPGGSIDFGETPLKAVAREVTEEIGISVKEGDFKLSACCAYTLKGSGCESHRIHIIYKMSLSAPLQIRLSNEHLAYQWVQAPTVLQGLSMIPEIREVIATNFTEQNT